MEVSGNRLENNWGGVTIWENADRFCNTAGSTAPGFCPIAGAATVEACVDPTIHLAPFRDDCRWKAQNVLVQDNDFIINKSAINCSNNCGHQGLFSNTGSFPAWSPYLGNVVQEAVTYNQNNRFNNNRYVGDWRFTSYNPGELYLFPCLAGGTITAGQHRHHWVTRRHLAARRSRRDRSGGNGPGERRGDEQPGWPA